MVNECYKCKSPLKSDAQFCGKRGAKVELVESPVQKVSAARPEVVAKPPSSTANPPRRFVTKRVIRWIGALFALLIVGWVVFNIIKDRTSSPLDGSYLSAEYQGKKQQLLFFPIGELAISGWSPDIRLDGHTTLIQHYRRYGQTIKTYPAHYNWFTSDLPSSDYLSYHFRMSQDGETVRDDHNQTWTKGDYTSHDNPML